MYISLITYLSVWRGDGKDFFARRGNKTIASLKLEGNKCIRLVFSCQAAGKSLASATFTLISASYGLDMDDLIKLLKTGNEAALKELMTMYKKPIYNYLNMLLGNRQLAEELTQDTFVKVYFKAHTLKTDQAQALKSWIYTIATNLARSEFRKKKIKKILSLADVSPRQVAQDPDLEGRMILAQMVTHVPEKWRVPLVMKEMDNFSFSEIAQMLDKPVGTVKSLVFRGKEHLKRQYLDPEGATHV